MATTNLDVPSTPETQNLVNALLSRARHSDREAAKHKARGEWQSIRWGEVIHRVRALSEGLVKLGIKPGERVGIFAQTRLEWCLADLAILGAGAVTVPIYASNTAREVEHLVRDCGAKAVFFDHDMPEGRTPGRWSRLREATARTPSVEHFVSFDLASRPDERVLSLADLEQHGRAALPENPRGLEERAANIRTDDLCCILYTSGTAGTPKGVMLTHGGFIAQAYSVMQAQVLVPGDLVLLFLPLAHVFAREAEATWICQDIGVVFAESVEKLVANAGEVGPTVLPAVPRVFEKAFNQVISEGSAKAGVQGMLFRRAMRLFDSYVAARQAGAPFHSLEWAALKRIVFASIGKRLRAKFGGKIRLFVSGGAPLAPTIGHFFEVCGFDLIEGYGLTETSSAVHCNRLGRIEFGTVGLALPGVETRIADDGEILLRGPMVMKGYYNMPEETRAALTEDGWLRTADIGSLDARGVLRITDRKKDLIKTSGGKFIAPQVLENALKTEPLISQVSIHGDGRKFVCALLTLSADNARKLAERHTPPCGEPPDLCSQPEIRARIQAAVDALNATLPSYATIKKFHVFEREWSQETGELTPTLKVKRSVVAERYKHILDHLYGEPSHEIRPPAPSPVQAPCPVLDSVASARRDSSKAGGFGT